MTATHTLLCFACLALTDGKLVPPRDYAGSLEERAQEAILIFEGAREPGEAVQDLILKIRVEGTAADFAWVVPFPHKPEVGKADPRLFAELFDYVETRRRLRMRKAKRQALGAEAAAGTKVEVLERRVVGSYDVALVREKKAGSLNGWLGDNGYQKLAGAEDVIGFYRQKGYVFACIKVTETALAKHGAVDLHPLRFTFKTGGRDAIYFPMKMTGLQSEPFDVNLYVFYRYWLNDRLSKYGFVHRGFRLRYRDWDTEDCEPHGGKAWSDPANDPFLRPLRARIPKLTHYMQARHPGEKFYLTNIQARRLDPGTVREWKDDLWLFPHYTDRDFVPYDARPGGPASGAYSSR